MTSSPPSSLRKTLSALQALRKMLSVFNEKIKIEDKQIIPTNHIKCLKHTVYFLVLKFTNISLTLSLF